MRSGSKARPAWTTPKWLSGFRRVAGPNNTPAEWEGATPFTREDPRVSKINGVWCLTWDGIPLGHMGNDRSIGLMTTDDEGYEVDRWTTMATPLLAYGGQPGIDDMNVAVGVLVPRPNGDIWMYYHTYTYGTPPLNLGYSCMATCPAAQWPTGMVPHPNNPIWPLVNGETHSYPDYIVPPEEAPDGKWHALCSATVDFVAWYIWHYTSDTGLPGSWARVGDPVVSPGSAPYMLVAPYCCGYGIHVNGVWYIPITGDNYGPPNGNWVTGILTTSDWVTFSMDQEPLRIQRLAEWERFATMEGCLVYRPEQSTVDLFYLGCDGSDRSRWHIGRARATNQFPP